MNCSKQLMNSFLRRSIRQEMGLKVTGDSKVYYGASMVLPLPEGKKLVGNADFNLRDGIAGCEVY